MIRSVRYGVALATAILAFALGAFGAPMIVSPADYSEVKTVSDRIWTDINSDTYLNLATYYKGTESDPFRANGTTDARTNSIPIRLQWVGSKGTSTVKLYRTRDLEKSASAEPIHTAQTEGNAITYFDPEVGRNYTWTVTDSTGTTATGHFYTMQRTPRVIYANQNPYVAGGEASVGRDIGGWLTADGTKRVQQGLLYRSAQLEYCSARNNEEVYAPLTHLQDNLKIRLDVDLRQGTDHLIKYGFVGENGWDCEWTESGKLSIDESSIGPLVRRYCVDYYAPAQFPSYNSLFSENKYKAAFWMGFYELYLSVKKGEPALFHCSHGKDRTGSLAYIILGALGVSETDCRRDFGFTWYSDAEDDVFMNKSGESDVMGYLGLDNIKSKLDAYSGSNFQEDCIAYLKECCAKAVASGKYSGSSDSAAVIAEFQSLMLEDVESKAAAAAEVAKPIGNSFVYTGAELTGVPEDERYTITGVSKATDVGSYTATLTLNDGYTWEDGTAADIEVTWSITDLVAGSGIVRNAISDAGYTVTGLGENGDEVAVVITNILDIYTWKAPKDLKYVKYLVVGGGGGGGGRAAYATGKFGGGAGGGGGGVVAGSIFSLKAGDKVSFKVGAGGIGGDKSTSYEEGRKGKGAASSGSDSSFKVNGENYVTAFGGGGDAGHGNTGAQGGSNAGNRGAVTTAQSYTAAGEIAPGAASLLSYTMYGNAGGVGFSEAYCPAAGGGGAVSPGVDVVFDGSIYKAGDGGAGFRSDITGTPVIYGSGGGGGATQMEGECLAGSGGVGAGDGSADGPGRSALPNQGGGGGGAATTGDGAGMGGNGGSGIIVLRYGMKSQPETDNPISNKKNTTVITYGDSVTRGSNAEEVEMDDRKNYFGGRLEGYAAMPESYPYWLSGMLSDTYNVINQSKGETCAIHVSSWLGIQPVSVGEAFTLPKTGSVTLNNNLYNLVFDNSTWGDEYNGAPTDEAKLSGFVPPVFPLSENYTADVTSDSIVGMLGGYRVRVQGSKAATLKVTALDDTLTENVSIPAGTKFIPESAVVDEYKNAIKVVCMGGNDWIRTRYTDVEDPYAYTYETHVRPLAMKLKSEGGRYLIVSPLFNPSGTSQYGELELPEATATEKLYESDFGENYLNLRLAVVRNIDRLAEELGISIDGNWYDAGRSIIAGDGVHLTSAGYKIKAFLIKEKLIELGYVTEIEKPEFTVKFPYDNTEKRCIHEGSGYVVSGVYKAVSAGTYKATVSLAPGYTWTDGTTDSFDITWTVDDTIIKVSDITALVKNSVYSGSVISCGLASAEKYTLSGTSSATEAGTYNVTVTPKTGYSWDDDSTGGKTFEWIIEKAPNVWIDEPSVSPKSWVEGTSPQVAYSLGKPKSETEVKYAITKNGESFSGTLDGVDTWTAGFYSIVFSVAETDNYLAMQKVVTIDVSESSDDGDISDLVIPEEWGRMLKNPSGDNDNEYVLIFTNHNNAAMRWTAPVTLRNVQFLVVGGGGGGGADGRYKTDAYLQGNAGGTGGAGGGGGGVVTGLVNFVKGSVIDVAVGNGGTGGKKGVSTRGISFVANDDSTYKAYGDSGKAGDSSFSVDGIVYVKAYAGGGDLGARSETDSLSNKPEDGGSGSGARWKYRFGDDTTQSAATKGYALDDASIIPYYKTFGNKGGRNTINYATGGGGGATEAGGDTVKATRTPGKGGEGLKSSITGTSVVYGSGGGGGAGLTEARSDLGAGIGAKGGTGAGNGNATPETDGSSANANQGGGGGGGGCRSNGGDGGSGIVVFRFTVEKEEEVPFEPGVVQLSDKYGYIVQNVGGNENEYAVVFTNENAGTISWRPPADLENVEFLVVGGGGGGGGSVYSSGGAGGGGGAVAYGTIQSLDMNSALTVVVGKGGTGGTGTTTKSDGNGASGQGGQSLVKVGEVLYVKALGGGNDVGYSSDFTVKGGVGGSNAGNRPKVDGAQSTKSDDSRGEINSAVATGTLLGNIGGIGGTSERAAGGGGGAKGPGVAASKETNSAGSTTSWTSGNGGEGYPSNITGEEVIYGAGGGAGITVYESSSITYTSGSAGAITAGMGGGGTDAKDKSPGGDALANCGGGGGGGGSGKSGNDSGELGNGGNGGSGIVVLRFSMPVVIETVKIAKPVAVTSFTYDGSEKTALTSGEGYALSGTTKAVDAGSYTVTATLKSGYAWSDDTTEAITFNWSIAKAANAWNTKPAITKTSWYTDEDAAVLTLGAAKFGEVVASMTKDGEEVAFSETLPTEAGNYTITFTVADSDNYGALAETITFAVIQASPVKINGEYGYVVPGLGVDGNEYAVVFTNDASTITWTAPKELKNVQFLVVGGGGGGGAINNSSNTRTTGAGGGGGGVVTGVVATLEKDATVTINIGKGGAAGKCAVNQYGGYGASENGGNSSFVYADKLTVTAYGGGGDGGAQDTSSSASKANAGKSGGSSGGSRPGCATKTAPLSTENCVISQIEGLVVYSEVFGKAGGAGNTEPIYDFYWIAGGGGGATEVGGDGNAAGDWHGGKGGEGLASKITGELKVYGSGGGGGSSVNNDGCGGVAGTGAGAGNTIHDGPGYDADANQGGGGGGSGVASNGGDGGSGIVVLRFSLEEEGETPEVPPTPASDWSEKPSLSKKIFNAGTAITVFNGTCENRTITANYTAAQIAALNPGTYTFRATASAAGVEPLVYEIDFWVLPADFSAENTIVCYGDSITYGDGAAKITIDDRGNYFDGRLKGENIKANYPYYLAGMIDDTKYNVIAQAKPQQWSDTILAWVGGVDVVTRNTLTLPASGSTVWAPTNLVFTAANPYGVNGGLQYVRDIQYPTVQTNYFAGAQMPALPAIETRPNPAGSASSMTGWLGDKRVRVYGKTAHPEFYDGATTADYAPDQEWARISADGSAVEIPAGTPFVPDTALVYNDAISVIFTGTNDEMGKKYWSENNAKDHTTYISMISDTVAKIPSGRYVVVSTLSINQRSDEIESAFAAEFGEHHLNLYKLMELYGLKTAVKLGIMTQAQADATTWDTKTTGLMNESVHPNEKGYQVIAHFLKQKLIELNYIEGKRDDDISFSYVARPAVDVTSFTYDGAEKVVVVEGENYTVTGTAKATNAGSYTATITPNEGFGWADGTIGAVTINWTIAKVANSWKTAPAISATSWTEGETATLTVGEADYGSVAISLKKDGAALEYTGSLPTEAGTYEITFTVAETENALGLTETLTFTIEKAADPEPPTPEEPEEPEEPKLEIDPAVGYIVRGLGELKDQVAVVFTNANNYAWTMPKSAKNIEFLVVGGGGGGGGHYKGTETKLNQGGSGGGGGAVVTGFVNNIASGAAMTINVGEGGEGGVAASGTTTDGLAGANGGNSYFKVGDVTYITAYGGGGDGGFASPGVAVGGSNSGSRGRYKGSTASITATALVSVEYIGAGADVSNVVYMRNKGTAGYETDSGAPGGGGGGAMSEGIKTNGSGSGSTGGAGYESDITGESKVYGSGGGSGLGKSVAGGAEIGKGGVGAGSGYANENGGDAIDNQGGGGGGGSYGKAGGDGGSGIVVLRFAYSEKDIVVDADTNVKPKISSKAYTGFTLTSGIGNTYAYSVEELADDLINVGKKSVRVTLNDGYVWSDGDQNKSKDFDWYIAEVKPMENGYKVVGLGEKGNEVALVYTNHTATINWTVPANLKNVQFLVVGGGGGGGADNTTSTTENKQGGGGGGGGGVVMGLIDFAKDENVTIKIGAGGKGGVRGVSNLNGFGGVESIAENSYFSIGTTVVTANAGGGDPGSTSKDTTESGAQTGAAGGSSSGSRSGATGRGEATRGKVEDSAGMVVSYSVLGNQGGAGYTAYQAGGGGGAIAEGESGTSHFGGNGGEGIALDISGTMVVYGSGGGGGTVMGAAIGAGVGGTGAGNGGHTTAATSALANQGGGGGGAGRVGNGGNGGSGIVVFRYVIPPEVNDVPIASENVFDEARVLKPIWYPVEPEKSTDDSGATVITYDGVAVKVPEYYNVEIAPAEKGGYTVSLTLNDLAMPRIANKIADGEVETPAIKVEGGKVVIHLEGTYPALKYTIETSDAIGAGAVWEDVEVADGGEDSEGKGSWLNKGNSDFEYKIGKENPSASRFFRVGAISDE